MKAASRAHIGGEWKPCSASSKDALYSELACQLRAAAKIILNGVEEFSRAFASMCDTTYESLESHTATKLDGFAAFVVDVMETRQLSTTEIKSLYVYTHIFIYIRVCACLCVSLSCTHEPLHFTHPTP